MSNPVVSAISTTVSEFSTSNALALATPISSTAVSSSSPRTVTAPPSISSSSFSLVSIPITAAVGRITITQPDQRSTAFYKIASGEVITFGWSMTGVIATPTSLTVSAVCDNGNTYAVGPSNGVIPGTATEVVWDVWAYQRANPAMPLAQASYTLNIWGDRGPYALERPGFLAKNDRMQFALYTPQAYTSIDDGWRCSVCNGAMVNVVHPAFISLLVTFFLVFFSGLHLLRTYSRMN